MNVIGLTLLDPNVIKYFLDMVLIYPIVKDSVLLIQLLAQLAQLAQLELLELLGLLEVLVLLEITDINVA
jgi:hypothetical protein